MVLDNDVIIYHGSYTIVEKPILSMCEPGKDFGLGFYLTTDIRQARRFVKSSIGKALKNGVELVDDYKGYVSFYNCPDSKKLNIYEFDTADSDWLHCVAAHRREGLFEDEVEKWEQYDVIIGKIADDTTNQVITAYLNGAYGDAGTKEADEFAISRLKPEKLTNQLCFRTKKAIESLVYMSNEVVEI